MNIEVVRNFGHLQEAVVAVDQKIKDFRDGTTDKIKASSGLILIRVNESGKTEILMGRLNKLNRPKPNDSAGVHNSFGLFSGGVELIDTGKEIPAVFQAAAREVREESLGTLNEEMVLDLLSLPSTKLIKNPGWKFFTAAAFQVKISSKEGEKIVNNFNSCIGNHPQHEITELAWISLEQLVEAQVAKEEEYNAMKLKLEDEQGHPFSADELRTNIELGKIYNTNIKLSCSVGVAHFVARTIFSIKDDLK